MNYLPPTPEMNPTLAMARSIMTPTARYAESKLLVERGRMEQRQQEEELLSKQAEEEIIRAISEAARAMRRGTQLDMLSRMQQRIQEERGVALGEEVSQGAVEKDILASMGLDVGGPEEDLGAESSNATSTKSSAWNMDEYLLPTPQQVISRRNVKGSSGGGLLTQFRPGAALLRAAPMLSSHGQTKMSMMDDLTEDLDSRELQNASLVGFSGPDESDMVEAYIEEMDPSKRDRARRAGILGAAGAGAGALAGIGANALTRTNVVRNLLKKAPSFLSSRKLPVATAALGFLGGGLLGGLSNRPITTTYNTATGDTLSRQEAATAKRIFDTLAPGSKPGNFAMTTDSNDLGGPRMGYAFDLDEAIAEDPEFASTLL